MAKSPGEGFQTIHRTPEISPTYSSAFPALKELCSRRWRQIESATWGQGPFTQQHFYLDWFTFALKRILELAITSKPLKYSQDSNATLQERASYDVIKRQGDLSRVRLR
jgi:hypothetical protein